MLPPARPGGLGAMMCTPLQFAEPAEPHLGASAGDCTGACFGAEALCFEAAGRSRSQTMDFVGAGNGAFSPVNTYSFVGDGRGDYNRETRVKYRLGNVRTECKALVGLLVLGVIVIPVLMWFFRPQHEAADAAPRAVPSPAVPALLPAALRPSPGRPGSELASASSAHAESRPGFMSAVSQAAAVGPDCREGRPCPSSSSNSQSWRACQTGAQDGRQEWTQLQKAYCCMHAKVGCARQGSTPSSA
mmetsp:Transcript_91922/g.274272  ORF Transcript_91922/g.274272 Transcript_91922/m.274272 type:complete len:245 (+) Transcript_91922:3-737(+)